MLSLHYRHASKLLTQQLRAYADVCSRMLTYAHVCSRMLTYADECRGQGCLKLFMQQAMPSCSTRRVHVTHPIAFGSHVAEQSLLKEP